MFTLELYDRNGIKLELGDIVKISDGRSFNFYSEVKYLPNEQVIAPFGTFTFHSVEKVFRLPENVIKSNETRYNVWYCPSDELSEDENAKHFENYLTEWRSCESLLEKRIFRIKPIQQSLFYVLITCFCN